MKKEKINIFWFRQDLRINDNPGFFEAVRIGSVLPIYIDDHELHTTSFGMPGQASRWWLHQSLLKLNYALDNRLNFYKGSPLEILKKLTTLYDVESIYWSRLYEPFHMERDRTIKEYFKSQNILCKSFNGSLLWEPHTILNQAQKPYRVFTAYYKNGCLNAPAPRLPISAPPLLHLFKDSGHALPLESLHYMPTIPWYTPFEHLWNVGEMGARKCFEDFIVDRLTSYKAGRDFPDKHSTSRLSPHLHFGEISPHQIWHTLQSQGAAEGIPYDAMEAFLRQLVWREFSYSLLYHCPTMITSNIQSRFNHFPWQDNDVHLKAWQKGMTGYPIIDAGMRELWQTGSMHNRIRMIVASFLVKNLNIHWRHGAEWFWDCLLDADLANNSASWQWVAGSGMDAAPYFRIFNPMLQGEKFDPDGNYTRRYVPELKDLPLKYLWSPWLAPKDLLARAGIVLGSTYPMPIIDYKASRDHALASFKTLP